MRSYLLLAALAALFCGALAGPYQGEGGCYSTDDIPRYKIEAYSFVDIVKGQWVKQAFVQAKARMRRMAELDYPEVKQCWFDGIKPVRGCYNSRIPGWVGPPQLVGQYGFVAHVQYVCDGGVEVYALCRARINTLRDNRLGKPSFWLDSNMKDKDIHCE
ncbi:hypothetical protein ABPG75_009417 [Micractinium tetrahymenae]